jgi:hypothetical protein
MEYEQMLGRDPLHADYVSDQRTLTCGDFIPFGNAQVAGT